MCSCDEVDRKSSQILTCGAFFQNIIFVDGHFSHINNVLLSQYCRDFSTTTGKRVEVFCLPAGQTAHLQPFDKAAFGSVRRRQKKMERVHSLLPAYTGRYGAYAIFLIS